MYDLICWLCKSIDWKIKSCSAFEKTRKQKHNTKSISNIKKEFLKIFGCLIAPLPVCRMMPVTLWIIWLHLILLYSINHCDCDLSCHDITDHQSGSQKTFMFVHEVIQHRFMIDIHDFQTKKDLLAFHNHLSLKVRKCYVEHSFF